MLHERGARGALDEPAHRAGDLHGVVDEALAQLGAQWENHLPMDEQWNRTGLYEPVPPLLVPRGLQPNAARPALQDWREHRVGALWAAGLVSERDDDVGHSGDLVPRRVLLSLGDRTRVVGRWDHSLVGQWGAEWELHERALPQRGRVPAVRIRADEAASNGRAVHVHRPHLRQRAVRFVVSIPRDSDAGSISS